MTTSLASIFADPNDLRRYNEAIANGATEKEALRVGDNGVSAWGEDTTSTTDPIVALSPDTPGFARNRLVAIEGPKGSVVARLAEKGPSDRIDLNPAAALAIGHTGGLVPVKWSFADGYTPSNASQEGSTDLSMFNIPDTNLGSTALPDIAGPLDGLQFLTPIGDQSSEIDMNSPADQPQDAVVDEGVQGAPHYFAKDAPPPLGTFVKMNPDGSKQYSSGLRVYHDHAEIDDGHGGTREFHTGVEGSFYYPQGKSPPTTSMQDPATGLTRKYAVKNGKLELMPIVGEEELQKPPEGVAGAEVLKSLTPEDQNYAKGVLEYRIRPTSGARGDPRYRRLRDYILAADPSYSEGEYDAVNKVRGAYASKAITQPGGQIISGNTILSQLGKLQNYADGLDNKTFQAYNSVGNYLKEKTGDPKISNFQGMRDSVISEFARYLTNGVPTDAARREAETYLSKASSPEQMKGIIQQVIPDVILPKLGTLDYEYTAGTHGGKLPGGVVDSTSKEVLNKFGVESPLLGNTQEKQSSATPASPTDPLEIAKQIHNDPNAPAKLKAAADLALGL